MRYTRQLATAALVVAAGLGMGACSAHPGAAIVTSSGATYSNADIHEAASQINVLAGGQQNYSDGEIRAKLMNQDAYAAGAAVAGITVTDEMINMLNQDAAAAHNAAPLELTAHDARRADGAHPRSAAARADADEPRCGQRDQQCDERGQCGQRHDAQPALPGLFRQWAAAPVRRRGCLPQDPDPSALMGGGQTGTRTQ